MIWLLLGLLPALMLGVVLSSTGHVASGPFVVACVMLFAVGQDGAMDAAVRRDPSSSAAHQRVLEAMIWAAAVAGYVWCCRVGRRRLRDRLPEWLVSPIRGGDRSLGLKRGRGISLLAGLVTALTAASLGWFCIVTPALSQVAFGVFTAMVVGGFLSALMLPGARCGPVLTAGLAVAAVGHAWSAWQLAGMSPQAVLSAWYVQDWSGLAMALPVVYASAGVAGGATGFGLAQAAGEAKHLLLMDEMNSVPAERKTAPKVAAPESQAGGDEPPLQDQAAESVDSPA